MAEELAEGPGRSQEFGDAHTVAKLDALRGYLTAYTTALGKTFRLHYVDAFAGSGSCDVRVSDGSRRTIPGSARIAIETSPAFDRIVLIEKHRPNADELERLAQRAGDREIKVVCADANEAIPHTVQGLGRGDRLVVFLDPFGTQVKWTTLQYLASMQAVDVLYLFPVFALYRQAPRKAAAMDRFKAAALTRMLGDEEEWRKGLYKPSPQGSLFGEPASEERDMSVQEMVDFVEARFKTLFPVVLKPLVLRQTRTDGKQGPVLFALFFAMSNKAPKAIGLATRIFNGAREAVQRPKT
jgi:three-Cys-motif partner protein